MATDWRCDVNTQVRNQLNQWLNGLRTDTNIVVYDGKNKLFYTLNGTLVLDLKQVAYLSE